MIEKQYKIEHLELRLKESHEEIQAFKNQAITYSDKEFEAILKENRQLREKIDEVIKHFKLFRFPSQKKILITYIFFERMNLLF